MSSASENDAAGSVGHGGSAKKYRILLYEPIHKVGLDLLLGTADVIYAPDFNEETVLSLVHDVDGIIIRGFGNITARIMDAAPKLRVIARHGAGLDNMDWEAAKERRIYAVHTPVANIQSVAEFSASMILYLSKRILPADRALRQGDWRARNRYIGREIRGKTLGIIGFGRIGQKVATICYRAFEMKILYYDVIAHSSVAQTLGAKRTALDDLMRQADYVSAHLPLLPETIGLIGAAQFALMKPTACFVNTGRGNTVDEAALVEALRSGSIAGAALDVFEVEPMVADNPLYQLENVIVTPHMAALTEEAIQRMAMVVQDVIRVLNGETPKHWANPWT